MYYKNYMIKKYKIKYRPRVIRKRTIMTITQITNE